MAIPAPYALFDGKIIPRNEANLSVASSAVLYGLSVYTVFFTKKTDAGFIGFRVSDHVERLKQSGRLIGFSNVESLFDEASFLKNIQELLAANQPANDQFFRVTIHATDLIPGVRTSNLKLSISVFSHDAVHILPQGGARLKTSLWRRTADTAIPARAKVNGAYVNSALAKQEAIDSGYDDCLFLNQNGYVSELSAANIFFVKRGELITPDLASDILEGITRRSIIELAKAKGITVTERKVALTELYTADEVFACGTSAFVSPIIEIDKRVIESGQSGPITLTLRDALKAVQAEKDHVWTTTLS